MRLSTNQMFNANVAGYQKGYADLVKTQEQITSGNRIQTPADDPVGSARLLQLEQQSALLGQYKNNLTDATNSLTQEHSILDSMILVSQRARELAGHAGNGAYNDHDRKAIASELQQIENELFGLMNSKDASGDYWFSGGQSGTQPYVRNSDGTYSYKGDESQRSLQVATGMQISIGDSGYAAFESARNVSRTTTEYIVTPPGTLDDKRMHLSQGTISTQRDFDSGFRAGAPYRLEVSGDPATGAISYEVFDKNNTPVPVQSGGVGTYDPKQENPKISFHGVEFTFDTLLKEGEAETDYAALLDGHSFEIGMAPDRFAVAGNSATAQITAATVDDANANAYAVGFPAGGVTLQFSSPTSFKAFAQPGNVEIGDETTIPGAIPGTITVAGVDLTIAGAPAADDQFKITADAQETQSILNTIVDLRKALERPADGIEGGGLRIREAIANALGNIDSGMIQIESTQAHIGARLNSIDTLTIENESLEILNADRKSVV